jgi:Transcriptional regulator
MSEKETNTKQKILEIAIHLFKEKGYDAVTIQDICKASGISKHTFYYHFESKEHILHEFVKIPYDVKPELMNELFKSESPLEKYFTLLEPRLTYLEKLGGRILKQLIFSGFHRQGGQFHHGTDNHPMMGVEVELLRQAQEKGEIRNQSDATELAQVAMILVISTSLRWAMENRKKSLKELIYKNLFVLFDIEESKKVLIK